MPLGPVARARQSAHVGKVMKRATKRPESFTKPAYWSNDPPPQPEANKVEEKLSPTRYGDWVKDGIAIDF